jgi:hypothetical protein
VEFVKSLVNSVATLLQGGNEKREARHFTETQKQRPQDHAMYVVDTEIDFEIAPIEFYRCPTLRWPEADLTSPHTGHSPLLTSGFGLYYMLWGLAVKSEENGSLPSLPIA